MAIMPLIGKGLDCPKDIGRSGITLEGLESKTGSFCGLSSGNETPDTGVSERELRPPHKLRLIRILITALLISWVLSRMATTVADGDLWGYLSFGRLFWETRRFPYHDIFSYVPTLHPWVYP
jgi:hypothetical protein